MAADVKLRIGCSLDKSLDTVLGDFAKRVDRATREMAKMSQAAERLKVEAVKNSTRQQLTEEEKLAREIERLDKHLTSSKAIELRRQIDAKKQALRDEVNAQRQSQRELERFASRTSYRATRFLFPRPEGMLGYAGRVGTDLLRGVGVDTSFGGGVRRAVELQRQAQILANNAYQPGQAGAAGIRVSAKELTDEAHKHAEAYGIEGGAETIIGGLTKFNKLTGDLRQGRDITADMVKLSAATGANFEDVMGAAAVLSKKLGEIPDKQKKIYELMRGFAWQGKLGAVEISDLASSMPRLLSGVTRFAGDTGINIAKLGALAQMARGGPASSAREAATGVARMADMFVKKTAIKNMKGIGLTESDLFVKGAGGARQVRDPFSIIMRALELTGGDPAKMMSAFRSTMGARPIERMIDLYRQGGGRGGGGIANVQKEIKMLMSGSGVGMSNEVVEDMAKRQSETMANKAQKFQDKLDRITESLAERLLPVLEQLAPDALKVAEAFSGVVKWAATNPGEAIVGAITLSIARAGLESGFRRSIEQALGVGTPFQTGAMQAGSSMMKFATVASNAITVIAAAVAAYELGKQGAESIAKRSAAEAGETGNVVDNLSLAHGADLAKSIAAAKEKVGKIKAQRAKRGGLDVGLSDWLERVGGGRSQGQDLASTENMIRLKEQELSRYNATGRAQRVSKLEAGEAAMLADAISGRTLKVQVMNPPAAAGNPSKVDPKGREPPPGQR